VEIVSLAPEAFRNLAGTRVEFHPRVNLAVGDNGRRSEGVAVAARASSRENRTLVLAWSLAEMSLVARSLGAPPLLAFDDFDSEWDPGVLAAFAEGLPEAGQVFLTSARPGAVQGLPLPAGALYRMISGQLVREGILGAGRDPGRRAARAGDR
jgi:recombinational DNA repair ATPase RecF